MINGVKAAIGVPIVAYGVSYLLDAKALHTENAIQQIIQAQLQTNSFLIILIGVMFLASINQEIAASCYPQGETKS